MGLKQKKEMNKSRKKREINKNEKINKIQFLINIVPTI